jgi:hypothetical protein
MQNASDLITKQFAPSRETIAGGVVNLPGCTDRFQWLRSRIDAVVRYVIRRQMAAARCEIRRGKDRLWIAPERE